MSKENNNAPFVLPADPRQPEAVAAFARELEAAFSGHDGPAAIMKALRLILNREPLPGGFHLDEMGEQDAALAMFQQVADFGLRRAAAV